ncbi:HAMP domain-containing protein [Pseudooceanicola sp. 216_PA32_1]|uniref:histidine kinase n=1 Tax=Pseudooceanicola pacificus TaxID=2676438 RepID=A0A844W4I4_9RHOB|nr:ATP-binding protein [Pseudooceanicola pacificus]MWB77975.1 HAMP domain-containing protein [Pseudooceanicola pacificus]
MTFGWLKRYVPRSLYGRALLILVLPVVTLQLVVSIVFIQRHFEGVTVQMTRNVSREIALLLDSAGRAPLGPLAMPLNIAVESVTEAEVPAENERRWFDLSGAVVIRTIFQLRPETRAVLLPDDSVVQIFSDSAIGPLRITFDRRRVSASNPHQLLVNMVFFGILMTAIAYIYLRNQLRPITRLAAAAEAFGRGRVESYWPGGANEVRAAGHAFVDMRNRIERHIEQRTLMLSGVSHDLRTPLTRLKLGLSMLDDDEARAMEHDVDDMQRMLDEFLAFARGAAEDEVESVNVIELVRAVVADAVRGGTNVTLGPMLGAGKVRMRPVAIRRALGNLIANAGRYGTRAEVSVLLTGKSLRIRVEDDGPGIPQDRIDEALRPFTRLEPARNQNRGTGVGLGLSIAADIARAHGGVLRLGRSEALGGLQADLVIGS